MYLVLFIPQLLFGIETEFYKIKFHQIKLI